MVLISHNKKKNAPIIFNLTGVGGYKGKAEQRRELFSRITRENYQEMQKRIKNLPSDDAVEGSTNFGKFIEYFSMDDSRWIQMINKALEEWLVFRKRMGYFWFCIAALIGKY